MKNLIKTFTNGILSENPTFRLVLGLCPTIAITTTLENSIGMGLATTFVLIGSNLVIALLKDFIPDKIRIPAFVVVICTFVTMIELLMKAYLPALNKSLGIFIPLIVVNCIILARAEAFASKNPILPSVVDGLGMGIGFTFSLSIIGSIREIIGNGTILGIHIMPASFNPMMVFALAPGGFITLGLTLGIINAITNKMAKKREESCK
ncbi:MAG: electron transport complex subunit E [Clostridiales bacterium]|nr:electron transport complex subunit E [Clostridiales bacterium]